MSIRSDVEYYFEKHVQEKIYLNELVENLQYSEDQLKPAVYWLTKNREGYEVIHQGQCWIFKPEAKLVGVETMTVTKWLLNGKALLEDHDGKLYVAKELDV